MGRLRFASLLTLLLLAAAGAYAGTLTVTTVPKNPRLNQAFSILITASGGKVGDLALPEIPGLRVQHPPSTMNSFQYVNGEVSSKRELSYRAIATARERIEIPALEVSIDGQLTQSAPVILDFTQGTPVSSAPPQGHSAPNVGTDPDAPPRDDDALTVEDCLFIESKVDKADVYQGEPVLLTLSTWRIIHREVATGAQRGFNASLPTTEGFYVVNLDPVRGQSERNGIPYEVQETRLLLFPTGMGEHVIGGWAFQGLVQQQDPQGFGFFSARSGRAFELNMRTEPITVNVRPLPERPTNFSGTVGVFTLKSSISRDNVYQGTPFHLDIRIIGEGNPDAVGAPKLPEIAGAYVGLPEVTSDSQTHADTVHVTKWFRYAITPSITGDLAIPALDYVYFDTQEAAYTTLTAPAYTVRVTPPPGGSARVVADALGAAQSASIQVLHEDLEQAILAPGPLRSARGLPLGVAVSVAAPPVAYLGLALVMGRQRRFAGNRALARSHFAKAKAHKRLSAIPQAAQPAEALSRTLIDFVADKFDRPAGGLTAQDIEHVLHEHEIEEDLTQSILKTIRACERVRYASQSLSQEEVRALLDATELNLDRLDAALKKGGGR